MDFWPVLLYGCKSRYGRAYFEKLSGPPQIKVYVFVNITENHIENKNRGNVE